MCPWLHETQVPVIQENAFANVVWYIWVNLSRPQCVKALLMSVSYRILARYITEQMWIIIVNIESYTSLKYLRNIFHIWNKPVIVISEPNKNVTGMLLFCKGLVWLQLPLIIACSARSQCSALSVIREWRLCVLNIVRCIKMIHYVSIHSHEWIVEIKSRVW